MYATCFGYIAIILAGNLTPVIATREAPYTRIFVKHGVKYGIAPELAMAVAWVESGFRKKAYSRAAAIGVMQVRLPTGRWLLPSKVFSRKNLESPDINIEAGIKYLAFLAKRYRNTSGKVVWPLALAGYAAGHGYVSRRVRRGLPLSSRLLSYIKRVRYELYVCYGLRFNDL